ncbi:MAG TPA: ATP-binding protein [Acidimicrobiales bacterium]|nr:ATP-binding protein [Acidimicrobiales bacterium]
MAAPIEEFLTRLRTEGGDTTEIEVKTAAGGLSPSLPASLCGLANLPGGGWVILGLDEANDFAPVVLSNLNGLKQGLAAMARGCVPPVRLEIEQAEVENMPVIVARVAECAVSAKPCRWNDRGWIRSFDGDHPMSELEEQAFLAQRDQPRFDRQTVTEATRRDLDDDLVSIWAETVAAADPRGLGRFVGEELLVRAGIISEAGLPTRAGLLVLGTQPQQFFPRFVVNLAASTDASGTTRAVGATAITGPIPVMLESALDWARRNMTSVVRQDADGRARDVPLFPLDAFRELISNALVHRDLDSWSEGLAVEVRLERDRLVVTNPGGLYGITVERLGKEATTSARNTRLVEICRHARDTAGGRVVETLATGIPRILSALEDAGLPPPLFQDTGIRFTVVLRQATPVPSEALTGSNRAVFAALAAGELDVHEIRQATGLTEPNIRRVLRALAAAGLVVSSGGKGRRTLYRRG